MAVAGLRKRATATRGGVRWGAPLFALAILASVAPLWAQVSPTEVRLDTADGIEVFGDLYWSEDTRGRPLILLFHQGGSDARAEYGPMIPRLMAAGFNALAIDQRRGGSMLGGSNRTVDALGEADFSYCDVYPDLEAALEYARRLEPDVRPIAWGSSYTAALVFRLALENPDAVAAVLAFSPASGEPMEGCRPESWSAQVTQPVLVLRRASEVEIPWIAQQFETLSSHGHRTYVSRPGAHASSMLNAARVDGDVEPTWAVVLDFLASVRAGSPEP